MAQVARSVQERADGLLDYLLAEWGDVPEIAHEWADMQPHERTDFLLEWPIREDRLRQLTSYAEQGALTPAQQARYRDLMRVVTQHRAVLARLLEG